MPSTPLVKSVTPKFSAGSPPATDPAELMMLVPVTVAATAGAAAASNRAPASAPKNLSFMSTSLYPIQDLHGGLNGRPAWAIRIGEGIIPSLTTRTPPPCRGGLARSGGRCGNGAPHAGRRSGLLALTLD